MAQRGRPKEGKTMSSQISIRLSPEDYEDYRKLCYLEYSQMAQITRKLVLSWIDKNRKKLK